MTDVIREYVAAVLLEKSGEGGAEYESVVFNAIRAAGASGAMTQTAGFDANLPDADITIGGVVYSVEVKMNGKAQMGGGSIGMKDGQFFAAGRDVDAMTPIADSLNSSEDSSELIAAIDDLCTFLNERTITGKTVTGFPMSGVSKVAWEEAVDAGLLVPINRRLESSVDFIAEHYAAKGTSYIQIGGQGLFYLMDNPANIPVPRLSGSVILEVRAARAGSGGKPTVGAGIRVQSRLKISGNSRYTLDDPQSIKQLLQSVKKGKR